MITASVRDFRDRATQMLKQRDPSLWSSAADVQAKIANRLGWLDSPQLMTGAVGRLTSFAASIRTASRTICLRARASPAC